ncbi:MAG: SprT family zinc-dependent metalloprotease [Betaproteobacteria bacterium]
MALLQRLLPYTLDLFDPQPAPVAPIKPKRARAATPKRAKITAPRDAAPAMAPAEDLWRGGLDEAAFRHPRASRALRLGETLVAYEFKRGKRRTIGFSVGPDGLAVSAPKWSPLYEVDAAVREKADWILKKLRQSRQHQARLESARIEWKDGATLPFLGDAVTLALDPSHAFLAVGAELKSEADAVSGELRRTLHIGLARQATPQQIRDAVQAWLMRQAKRVFAERLDHYAPQLGVQWQRLSLSNAGTRWGSAKSDGSIRLNWRLIHFKLSVIDYVVAHELSHLRVMDHSPRFWDTVRTVVPDYAALRGQLKDDALPRWS